MSRIATINNTNADFEQKAMLDGIRLKLGMVPNFLRILANSPAALRAFLGLHSVANEGSIDAQTRQRIALAMAQANSCDYCISAHTAIGRKSGLSGDEIAAARAGTSEDAQAETAVKFALSLLEKRGAVSAAELDEVRAAGYSDADIVEIITHVGMNFLTNILNKASGTEIDFPKVELHPAA